MEDWQPNPDHMPPKAGEPPLHRAARLGDHEEIRVLVANGADINQGFDIELDRGCRDKPLATPLMVAAGSGEGASIETVKLLLDLGADATIMSENRSAATYASQGLGWNYPPGGDAERLQMVLAAGSPLPTDPEELNRFLCHSVLEGNPAVLKVLLAQRLNPNGHWDPEKAKADHQDLLTDLSWGDDDPFAYLSGEMKESMAKIRQEMNQESFDHFTSGPSHYQIPLHCAAQSGSAECVRLLIEAGVDPLKRDSSKRTALYYSDSAEVVDALLAAGVPLEDADEHGWSPLVDALSNGEYARARLKALLAAGADVNGTHDRGYTVFMSAVGAMERNRASLKLLVEAGANPHAVSELGYNAFHAAIDVNGEANEEGSVRAVMGYLKELGVDIELRNADGKTPLARAIQDGTGTEVKVLCELGADPNAIAPMHQCGPRECAAIDLPLIFHATIGIGVHSDVKTEALLKAGADPWVVDTDGYHPISRVAGALCSDAKSPQKHYTEFFKILDALPEPTEMPTDRDEFVRELARLIRARLEPWAKKIPVQRDSMYAEETREEQLNCISSLAAYMTWFEVTGKEN